MTKSSAAISIVVGLAAGCASHPEPVTGIGPEGGTVESDGAMLTIPPGALAAQTEITIVATDQVAPAGFTTASTIYQFMPEGLTFATPVEARIDFVGSSQGIELIWSTASGDGFEQRGGSIDGSTVIGQIEHFSQGFAGTRVVDPCGGPCAAGQVCQAGVCVAVTQCNDGIDNDGDGLIDGADPDCMYNNGVSESLPST